MREVPGMLPFYVTFERPGISMDDLLDPDMAYDEREFANQEEAMDFADTVNKTGRYAGVYRRTKPVRVEVKEDGIWWQSYDDSECIEDEY